MLDAIQGLHPDRCWSNSSETVHTAISAKDHGNTPFSHGKMNTNTGIQVPSWELLFFQENVAYLEIRFL